MPFSLRTTLRTSYEFDLKRHRSISKNYPLSRWLISQRIFDKFENASADTLGTSNYISLTWSRSREPLKVPGPRKFWRFSWVGYNYFPSRIGSIIKSMQMKNDLFPRKQFEIHQILVERETVAAFCIIPICFTCKDLSSQVGNTTYSCSMKIDSRNNNWNRNLSSTS